MTRPALPKMRRGDTLVMVSRGPTWSGLGKPTDVRVVAVGPKYVHVVKASHFGGEYERAYARKFLLADQREGGPSDRVGYPIEVFTAAQWAWVRLNGEARDYLLSQGITIVHNSPWQGREADLARAVKAAVDA